MTIRRNSHKIAASAIAVLMLVIDPAPTAAAGSSDPAWTFDPAGPGSDHPPVGRSLFDHLFLSERDGGEVYDVPFPFSALRDRILLNLGGERGRAALKQVLIPYGRALPRDAAAPNHLKHPRIVLVVNGDTTAAGSVALLKDRLFIGYQEKAESLEVISYNEPAGRFEFQVVENYAAGRAPRVTYAKRRLCVACHQNGAPIFSAPLWSETNGSPEIGEAILDIARDIHGIPSYAGTQTIDQPRAIGESVRRANRFSAYQAIWRKGCGAGSLTPAAAECRAAAMTLALQFKLGGGRNIDTDADIYQTRIVRQLSENWPRHWPAGMAIPDPTLTDRNPLEVGIDVAADFDPLRLRPPLETWDGVAERIGGRAVEGLAQFISNDDVRRLDTHLLIRGQNNGAQRITSKIPCAVSSRAIEGQRRRIVFRCDSDDPEGASVTGFFYIAADHPIRGEIQRFTKGASVSFEELSFSADGVTAGPGGSRIVFRPMVKRTGLNARMPDGNAIESIRLSWRAVIEEDFGPSDEMPEYTDNGRIVVTVIADFAPVHQAVAGMVDDAATDPTEALSDLPFRRVALMRALFARLNLQSGEWCCEDDRGFPPAVVEASLTPPNSVAADSGESATILHVFAAYCGACHDRADRLPANFLRGDADQRRERITQCAERIAFRLAMWEHDMAARTKSPMPPATWLKSAGMTPKRWHANPDYRLMRGYVNGLLPETKVGSPTDSALRTPAYADLKPCLAGAK